MADPTDSAAPTNGKQHDIRRHPAGSSSRTSAPTGPNLRQEWARRIGEARLLAALTQEEIF